MKVPFLDLSAHHQPIREQLDAAIRDVIDANAFAGGPFVAAFEQTLPAIAEPAMPLAWATAPMHSGCALLALDVGPGDEVHHRPQHFHGDSRGHQLLRGAARNLLILTSRPTRWTRHCWSGPSRPEPRRSSPSISLASARIWIRFWNIADKHGMPVVEDACQAHGALYKGRKAGTMGVAGCFSFYPGKNLGALGEAGGVTQMTKNWSGKVQVFRDHGQHKRYHHSRVGWNARMDGIQGAVLSVKLKQLDVDNVRRRAHGSALRPAFGQGGGDHHAVEAPHNRHVYHIYAVRVKERNQILQALADKGISCAIHYPIPVHLQEAYRFLGCEEGSFPVAERCAEEFLSLPMFPELSKEQIQAVAGSLLSCLSSGKPVKGCLA